VTEVIDAEVVEEEPMPAQEVAVRKPAHDLTDYTPDIRRTPEEVKESLERIEGVAKDHLRKDIDYMVIPGTNKPTLTKAGAERLARFFSLFMDEELVEREIDRSLDPPFIMYTYRVKVGPLDSEGKLIPIAVCEGSANSWESKWRWRTTKPVCPACGQETIIKGKKEYGGGWVCFKKQGGCGNNYADDDPAITRQPMGKATNDDVWSYINSIQKMSQKRAFVGAVLIATGSSEFFTQDMEDSPLNTSQSPAPGRARTDSQPKQDSTPAQSGSGDSEKPKAASKAQLGKLFATAKDKGKRDVVDSAVHDVKQKYGVVPKDWVSKQIDRLNELPDVKPDEETVAETQHEPDPSAPDDPTPITPEDIRQAFDADELTDDDDIGF
jgi:hypothetical protein